MAIPKSKSMHNRIASEQDKASTLGSMERSYGILDGVKEKSYNKVEVYNDYVAILRLPRESTIALPGSSEHSNNGVVVGFGPNCVNKFGLGDVVCLNPKGGVISELEIDGYDNGVLHLFLEKNIFCKSSKTVNITVS
jgi:hypothetical protein